MNDCTETPQWGSIALVSYIPDPLGSFLHRLRQSLSGEDTQPHITILPPRPLKLPVDAASQLALAILRRFSAFAVKLSKVYLFPETNFLYLDITEGNELLSNLHDALNSGDLQDTEEFPFLAHLTLGGPVAAGDIELVQEQAEYAWRAAECPRSFTLDEVDFLWLGPGSAQGNWTRLWSHRLSQKADGARAAAAVTRRY